MLRLSRPAVAIALIACFAFPTSSHAGWGLFKCLRSRSTKCCEPCEPTCCQVKPPKSAGYYAIGMLEGDPTEYTGDCCATREGAAACLTHAYPDHIFDTIEYEECSYDLPNACCDPPSPPPPPPIPPAKWMGFYSDDGGRNFLPATTTFGTIHDTAKKLEQFVGRCDRSCRKYLIMKVSP